MDFELVTATFPCWFLAGMSNEAGVSSPVSRAGAKYGDLELPKDQDPPFGLTNV